jgi:hypothetical protein
MIDIGLLHFAAFPRILALMLSVTRQSQFLPIGSPSGLLLLYLLR